MGATINAGTYEGLTAAEWMEKSQESAKARAKSQQNSDSDGFLSQWASGVMAEKYAMSAQLAEANGLAEFEALFDLDGNYVPSKWVDTRYGAAHALIDPNNPDGRYLGFFNPSEAKSAKTRRKNNAKKGYTVGTVLAKAVVGEAAFRQVEFLDVEIISTDSEV